MARLGLHLGESFYARVIELQGEKEFVVSIEGRLLRVVNHSHRSLVVGEKVLLEVVSLAPLHFRLKQSSTNKLNINI